MQGKSSVFSGRHVDYLDFELKIDSDGSRGYRVAVIRSPAGQSQEMMRFPFGDLELENRFLAVRNVLLSSGKKRRRVLSQENQTVRDFGQVLFDALLVEEVRSRYDVSRRAAWEQGKGLRLKLHIQSPELAVLPWEFLYDSREEEYVCLSRDTPLVRYLEVPQPILPLSVTPPLRILGMAVCPSNFEQLDLDRERQWIEEATQDLKAKGLVTLNWLQGQTWRDLQDAMQEGPWHVFHFIGHGGFDREADEGFIVLANESGKDDRLHARELGLLLADRHSMRLALLNACEGARESGQDISSSTAATLIRRGFAAVVAMQCEITDLAAVEFARSFYGALAKGMPVDAAVAEARKTVSLAVKDTVEWGIPVLHMRSPDGMLFHIQGQANSDEVHETVVSEVSPEVKKSSVQETKEVSRQEVPVATLSISLGALLGRLEELYIQGTESLRRGLLEEARRAFEEVISVDPEYRDAWQKLNDVVAEAEKFGKLERLYIAGMVCCTNGRWEAAVKYLTLIADSGEKYKDTDVLLEKASKQLRLQTLYADAQAQSKAEKWAEAVKTLEEIVRIDPSYKETKAKLDHAREQQRLQSLYEEALGYLSAERWLRAIKILETIPNYRDAAQRLKEARKQLGLDELYSVAVGLQEAGKFDDAIDKFGRITRRVPVYKDVAGRLARIQRQQDMDRWFKLGENYSHQKQWKKAEEEFARVHMADPDYRDVQIRLEEARWQLHVEGLRERGEASLCAENWQEAIEAFEELHRLAPLDTSAIAKLEEGRKQLRLQESYDEGMEYFEKRKWGRARVALVKVVILDSGYRDAAARLDVARERSRRSKWVAEALRDPVWQGIGGLVALIALIVAVSPFIRDTFVNPTTPIPKPPTPCNGTFDDKFECWEYGGELKQSVKCEGGQCYAVLGSPDYKCEGEVPLAEAWIKQSFQISPTIATSPTLSLRYRVFSYDLDTQDWFQVKINGDLVGQFGNPSGGVPSCDLGPWDSGWQTVEFDLSRYKGQSVEVLLSNVNGKYEWWNTWTHVDDVQIR